MTDPPTPETNETHRLNCLPSTPEDTAYRYILDLSRRLERERDEAREVITAVLSALGAEWNECPRLAALRAKEEFHNAMALAALKWEAIALREKAREELATWEEARK